MIYWLLFLAYAALLILSLVSIFQVSVIVGVVCLLFIVAGFVLSFYVRRFRAELDFIKFKTSCVKQDENK